MDAQVINEGRHQGGRAPFGYVVVDSGPHPNPRKAAEGFRLRVLAIEDATADVVRRIFAEYLDGNGDRAIANMLNLDGVPCPSAQRPEQNRHRLADGWQGSTVRSILENPRYTGFAFFGRWTRQEMLLDPEDVAAGNVVRFRRAAPDKVVRSRLPAHPAIVSVEDFTQAQLIRRAKGAGGLSTARKAERGGRRTRHVYLFRGLVRCADCGRKMEGSPRKHGMYYRCPARTLAPGSPALATHPPTIYVREEPLRDAVNGWIHELFGRENVARTVRQLVQAQTLPRKGEGSASARRRLEEAEAKLRRLQAAIVAGVEPAALVESMNQAQADRSMAQAELATDRTPSGLTDAEIYAMIDSLGDVGSALSGARPEKLAELYRDLRLELRYDNEKETVCATVSPRVNSAGVRGGN